MSEAAATALAPEPAPATDALLMQAIAELKACRAANEAARTERGDLPELILTAHRLAELQDKLYQLAMSRTLAEIEQAAEPEAEPARHRHRAPRSRPAGQERALRAVREGGVVGGLVAAFRPAHAWVTGHVGTSVAVAGTAATLAVGAVVAPHAGVTLPFGASTSSTPAPSASIVAATPISVSGPLPSRVALALTKPKPNSVTSSPLAFPPVSSPVQGPGDGQDPQPSSQALAPQVRLVVTHALNLGTLSSGQIRVTAFGGTASWSASASDPRMSLDSASGTLGPGQSAVITVSISADLQALAESGSVTVSYDGQAVTIPVTWAVIPLPVPSPSDVVPSEVASILPPTGS